MQALIRCLCCRSCIPFLFLRRRPFSPPPSPPMSPPPIPSRRAAAPALACGLSFAAFRDRFLRDRFLSAGLQSLTVTLPSGATVHLWAPPGPGEEPGRRPLLLLHGFGASATWQWAPYLTRLITSGFDLYVPDLIFFGRSGSPEPDRSVAYQASTILEALDRVGLAGRFDVAGVSYGGFVAYEMANRRPDRVRKVVLVCAGVCVEEEDLITGVAPVSSAAEAAALLVPRRPDELRQLVRLAFHRPPVLMPSCFLKDYIQVMGSDYMEEKAELIYTLINNRRLGDLPKIGQPALIVWGEDDRVFPIELAYRLKSHLGGGAQLVIIKNAGHAVNLEKPKQLCKHMISFFQECDSAAPNGSESSDMV